MNRADTAMTLQEKRTWGETARALQNGIVEVFEAGPVPPVKRTASIKWATATATLMLTEIRLFGNAWQKSLALYLEDICKALAKGDKRSAYDSIVAINAILDESAK